MNKKVITIISIMTMTLFINNFAHPVTPELVDSIGYGSFLLGVLFAAMAFANLTLSPFWGKMSDKYGRKPFMIMGPIGYSFAQLGFGFSTHPLAIIFFRLMAGGIACASFVCGMAYLIDVTDKHNRTKIMALYTAVTGFAGTLGHLAGGFIGDSNYHYTFIAQSSLSLVSSLVIFIFLKESHHKTQLVQKGSLIKDFKKYRNTLVPFLLLITMFTSFVFIGFRNSFNSYMKFVMDLGPKYIGIVMAITGLIGIMMNIGIFPLIKKKFNDYNALAISLIMMGITLSLAIVYESINFNITIVILIVFFAFLALYRPLLQSIISKLGHRNGEIMGLNNASHAFGMMGGSFYAGAIFELHVSATFYSLAFICFIIFLLLLGKRNNFEKIG